MLPKTKQSMKHKHIVRKTNQGVAERLCNINSHNTTGNAGLSPHQQRQEAIEISFFKWMLRIP